MGLKTFSASGAAMRFKKLTVACRLAMPLGRPNESTRYTNVPLHPASGRCRGFSALHAPLQLFLRFGKRRYRGVDDRGLRVPLGVVLENGVECVGLAGIRPPVEDFQPVIGREAVLRRAA